MLLVTLRLSYPMMPLLFRENNGEPGKRGGDEGHFPFLMDFDENRVSFKSFIFSLLALPAIMH